MQAPFPVHLLQGVPAFPLATCVHTDPMPFPACMSLMPPAVDVGPLDHGHPATVGWSGCSAPYAQFILCRVGQLSGPSLGPEAGGCVVAN